MISFYLLTHSRHFLFFFFFNDTATTEIYTLSLHDALPISPPPRRAAAVRGDRCAGAADGADALHGRSGSGRSDRAQCAARHLYKLRQPARLVRARRAGGIASWPFRQRHSASRWWRPAAMMAF